IFPNYNAFRAYALRKHSLVKPTIEHPVIIAANNHNPFINADVSEISIDVKNNRNKALEGTINISGEIFEPQSQENPGGEAIAENNFKAILENPPLGNISLFNVDLLLLEYEKSFERALFFPCGSVEKTETDGLYTINNGCIKFKTDPKYAHSLFSLIYQKENGEEQEWLKHNYPEHAPFAFWNPFIGGIHSAFDDMSTEQMLKEQISAEFIETADNFGNIWHGIRTTLDVREFEDKKGFALHSYYLTLPGLPIICNFFECANNSGLTEYMGLYNRTRLFGGEELKDSCIEVYDIAKDKRTMRMGSVDQESPLENLMKLMSSSREESLYIFKPKKSPSIVETNSAGGDNKIISFVSSFEMQIPNGGAFKSSPAFYIISKHELSSDALSDLERIKFDENN
ncbi:MAG: hypothetical protein FWD01_05430, partial [Defluviitaleaceae bacterium]|nr:hypothetical protein [Defluviitaleaceae bacterium]